MKRDERQLGMLDRGSEGINMIMLKDCPFCGTNLNEFPKVMIIRPVHSDEYLIKKLENKKIIGSDADYAVHCIQCGVVGKRGHDRITAAQYWNRRV